MITDTCRPSDMLAGLLRARVVMKRLKLLKTIKLGPNATISRAIHP